MEKYRIDKGYSTLGEADKNDRPREKLGRLGAEALTDEELLMLIIGSGTQNRSVDRIARELLGKLDSNPGLGRNEIMLIPGIGEAKASALDAALELGRRRGGRKGRTVTSPADIFREVCHYSSREQEHLLVVLMNGAHEVMTTIVATMGLLNRTIVHPREVFSEAVRQRAAAVAIAHNHPSGNTEPSKEDVEVTKRLSECGRILGINVIDHIIFSEDRYYSFLEHGLI